MDIKELSRKAREADLAANIKKQLEEAQAAAAREAQSRKDHKAATELFSRAVDFFTATPGATLQLYSQSQEDSGEIQITLKLLREAGFNVVTHTEEPEIRNSRSTIDAQLRPKYKYLISVPRDL